MKNSLLAAAALLTLTVMSCENNPLLEESTLYGGAPRFDRIRTEHYLPAFKKGIEEGKAEIDAIVADPREPDFENTIEAMEFAGKTFSRVAGIFYNILEADQTPELLAIAEEMSPLETEYSMYIQLNEPLFKRIKYVYDRKDSLGLSADQMKLLTDTYDGFVLNGALLSAEDKKTYSDISEKLSLASLKFSKNVLAATNAFQMVLTDSTDLAGLPAYVVEAAAQSAKEKGVAGWRFDLSYPSYSPFLKYSQRRDLREKMYMAYNTRCIGGEFDNTQTVREIANLRLQKARILGFDTYAHYALKTRMLKTPQQVNSFLKALSDPAVPVAKAEVRAVEKYARANGFNEKEFKAWDWSFWSEKYKDSLFSVNEAAVKPYLRLESCIDAVFGLATRLYGLQFEPRTDLPVYHKDVKVFDVKDASGEHLALFYADFFPRETKRGGAWMTEFSEQSIENGIERRPVVSIVTNFSKPTGDEPSLLTHDELETFMHEFGHSIHGMLAKGRYPSMTGTSVSRDFVELPSQIMENWAFEPEYLQGFAKHYKTGEPMPEELIRNISASRNYNAAYGHIRQLQFGIMDMAWHSLTEAFEGDAVKFEADAIKSVIVSDRPEGTATSPAFTHLFSGGYAAGYYSYKWAEVLEADAFSLFKQEGIFSTEVASRFRKEILEKGSSEDEAVLYRNFRGHDPEPAALLRKLGIIR